MFIYSTKVRIRYAETDQMGYVYYGNYAQFYEIGRTEMLRSLGLTYKWMEEVGVIMPVAELRCKYIKPAFYDEEITIKVIVAEMPSRRIHFSYELYNETNTLINVGETVLAFVDIHTKRPCMPPKEFLHRIESFFKKCMMEWLYEFLSKHKIFSVFIAWSKRQKFSILDHLSLYTVGYFFFKELYRDSISDKANSLAYNFLLAIFPTLIFLFTLIPYLPIHDFQNQLLLLIGLLLPKNTFLVVESTLHDIIRNQNSKLLSFGFISAALFATNGMLNLLDAFNKYALARETRTWLKQRAVAFLLTIMIAFALILGLIIITFSEYAFAFLKSELFFEDSFWRYVILSARWIIMIIIYFTTTSILYRYGPSTTTRCGFFSLGAFVATILAILTVLGFSYYINHFGTYNKLYGSMGALIVVMIWLYLNSFILLLGFELNASIDLAKRSIKNN